ncbi:MAG: hypothetical protein CM1200mP40_32310 [Gammaproteobacteria bacterium]|nr:MAG: hypothetical protein CM1200mP40_32310 [Gammaproteobacteria bacterium]
MTKKLILLLPGVFSLWLAPSLLFGHAGILTKMAVITGDSHITAI